MTREETVATEGLLERIRALIPTLKSAGDRIEAERRLPPDVLDALHQAGAFRMAFPAEYGGIGFDPVTWARVVEEVASADASAGWCVMVSSQVSGSMAAYLTPEGARAIFSKPNAMLCGVSRPCGKAVPVEGGFRVSGHWPFASASAHATWLVGECHVYEDGEKVLNPRGNPCSLMCVFPREQVKIIDTWNVTGLRGTGSNDFVVEDVLVPEERACLFGHPQPTLPEYAVLCLLLIGHGAHALGIARSALEAIQELALKKGGIASGGRSYREQTRFQAEFAHAHTLVEAARHHLYATATEFRARFTPGRLPDPVEEARVRLANNLAVHQSLEAFDLLHRMMGTSSLFTGSPLERRFRDLHTASAHLAVSVPIQEAAGRALLGLDPMYP